MGAIARRERARRKSVRIGLVTLMSTVLLTAFAVTATNGLPDYLPGVERGTVQATFTDTGALREGDDVRIANVRAGFVDSIELVDGKPVVTLKLDGDDAVYADASAEIYARSSLGQKYVELNPGTESAGALASVIAGTRPHSATELDDLLEAFDPRTRAALGTTLRNLGGVGGRGQDLKDALSSAPDLLADLGTVSDSLASGDLADLLDTAASLGSALEDQSGQIADDSRQLATTLAALATDDGRALEETIRTAPQALRRTREALEALGGPLDATRVATQRLRPGAAALGAATPALRGLLRDSVVPLGKVPPVAGQAEDAVGALTPALVAARHTTAELKDAIAAVARIVVTLSPFSSEALDFFANGASALSLGDSAGHWLRFITVVSPENLSGNLPLRSPLTHREAYPAPGEAASHRTNNLGGLQ